MKLRVAVVYGGRSGEHEVSLRSAEAIMSAMDPEKYKVLQYFIDKDGKWRPRPIVAEPNGNPEIDVVFPALHGTFGEDGTVQGLLELADLAYVGPRVLASAASMDKEMAKRIFRERGLPVVEYVTAARGETAPGLPFNLPVFVKPANLGSSVGISKASTPGELTAALEVAAQYDRKILIERAISGQELECSVLGNEEPIASIPCEILPSRAFYDYDDKYLLNTAEFRIPAEIGESQIEEVRRLAVEAYKAIGCEGMARVDFLLESSSGKLYINEINTIPGFTSISMYPKMWEHTGIPFAKLVDRLISLALERHEARKSIRYAR